MCSQFYDGEVTSSYSLFKFIVTDTHELVYWEMLAFVYRADIAGHFREKRVKPARAHDPSRSFRSLALIRAACRRGASITHVIRRGTCNFTPRYFINNHE